MLLSVLVALFPILHKQYKQTSFSKGFTSAYAALPLQSHFEKKYKEFPPLSQGHFNSWRGWGPNHWSGTDHRQIIYHLSHSCHKWYKWYQMTIKLSSDQIRCSAMFTWLAQISIKFDLIWFLESMYPSDVLIFLQINSNFCTSSSRSSQLWGLSSWFFQSQTIFL